MVYKTRSEAKIAFRNYIELDNPDAIEWFSNSERSKDLKIGNFILFQHIYENKISRPILALFIGWSYWDMALVMSFVEVPRAYYYSDKYQVSINKDLDLAEYIGHMDPEVETIQFWTDNIKLLGHFEIKPKFRELKICLKLHNI